MRPDGDDIMTTYYLTLSGQATSNKGGGPG